MYVRKTIDCWIFYCDYGQGWEEETREYTRREMLINRKAYHENSRYPLKIVKKRVPITKYNVKYVGHQYD